MSFLENCNRLYQEPELNFDCLTQPHKAVNGYIWKKIDESKGTLKEKAWHVARWASNVLFLILNAPAIGLKKIDLSIHNYHDKQKALAMVRDDFTFQNPAYMVYCDPAIEEEFMKEMDKKLNTPADFPDGWRHPKEANRFSSRYRRSSYIKQYIETVFALHNARCERVANVIMGDSYLRQDECPDYVTHELRAFQIQICLKGSQSQIKTKPIEICQAYGFQRLEQERKHQVALAE